MNQSVNLDGWHLTDKSDNLNKWEFPNITLGPGEYRVIFASEKDRTDPNQPLHTNFKLSAGGEYLALVRPDGVTVEFDYGDEYPSQTDDVSYGISTDQTVEGLLSASFSGCGQSRTADLGSVAIGDHQRDHVPSAAGRHTRCGKRDGRVHRASQSRFRIDRRWRLAVHAWCADDSARCNDSRRWLSRRRC